MTEFLKWVVWADEAVAGADYGKRIRDMAAQGVRLIVTELEQPLPECAGVIVMGRRIDAAAPLTQPVVLIASAVCEEAGAAQLLKTVPRFRLINPGYDEDGRVALWSRQVEPLSEKGDMIVFEGFENDLTQRWSEVMQSLPFRTDVQR